MEKLRTYRGVVIDAYGEPRGCEDFETIVDAIVYARTLAQRIITTEDPPADSSDPCTTVQICWEWPEDEEWPEWACMHDERWVDFLIPCDDGNLHRMCKDGYAVITPEEAALIIEEDPEYFYEA